MAKASGTDAVGPMISGNLLGIIGRFLSVNGINGAVLLLLAYLVWAGVEDRRQDSEGYGRQLTVLSGQVQGLAASLTEHQIEGREMIRILTSLCVNAAQNEAARDRCVGR